MLYRNFIEAYNQLQIKEQVIKTTIYPINIKKVKLRLTLNIPKFPS